MPPGSPELIYGPTIADLASSKERIVDLPESFVAKSSPIDSAVAAAAHTHADNFCYKLLNYCRVRR